MEEQLIQQWLDKNTISCPLGRITKKQCVENRKRPLLTEKTTHVYRTKITKGNEIVYMPRVCYDCKVYKKFFTKEEIKKHEKEINDFRNKYFIKMRSVSIFEKELYGKEEDTFFNKKLQPEKKKKVCLLCNQLKVHHGRGLCSSCYTRLKKYKLLDKYTKTKALTLSEYELIEIESSKKNLITSGK